MGTPFLLYIEKVIKTFHANKLLGISSPFNPCTPRNLVTKGPLKFSYNYLACLYAKHFLAFCS